jgi:hypothetical protein
LKQNLIFKQKPEAKIEVKAKDKKLSIEIKDFYSPILMRKLEIENEKVLKKDDKAKVEALKPIDTRGLLDVPEPPESIDDLFSKDTFGLFEGAGENILRIKNVPLAKRSAPEDVASRVRAKDFDKFRDGFDETQKGLGIGTLKLVRFTNVKQLKAGRYFIAGGQMLYVDDIGEEKLVHGRMKSRLRAIYENGTESNLYLRSLSSQLYYDGYCVVESDYAAELKLDSDDKIVGYIYVLKSLSEDEKVMAVKDLHKIGFTITTITERIKDAEKHNRGKERYFTAQQQTQKTLNFEQRTLEKHKTRQKKERRMAA